MKEQQKAPSATPKYYVPRRSEVITTPVGTAYGVYLAEPYTYRFEHDGTVYEPAYYAVTVVYDAADDLSEIERIVWEAAAAGFGDDAEAALRDQGKLAAARYQDGIIAEAFGPFRTAGPASKYFPPGSVRVQLKCDAEFSDAPAVVGTAPDENGLPAALPASEIYSGMRIKARTNAFAFGFKEPFVFSVAGDTFCSRGVLLGLGPVQKVGAGVRL